VSGAAWDRARLLAARGSPEQALEAVDELLAESPEHVGALLLKAALLGERRDPEEALPLCRRAVALAAGSAEAWNALARCLHALGRDEDALTAAERARRLLADGDNGRFVGPVYLTLLWCLREQRRYLEALAAAEEGLSRCGDAILAQWASVVEEELAAAQREEC
jgi:tetratricopeptide (TPR) repeat protein